MTPKRCIYCFSRTKPAPIRMWGTAHACRDCALSQGGTPGRRAVAQFDVLQSGEGWTPAVLKALAADGIMDSNALFLPAGRVSKAEADARADVLVGDAA